METLIGLGHSDEVGANLERVGALLVAQLPLRDAARSDWDRRVYLATCAVESAIRAAAYKSAPFFASAAFEDALVQMVQSLLPEIRNNAMQ